MRYRAISLTFADRTARMGGDSGTPPAGGAAPAWHVSLPDDLKSNQAVTRHASTTDLIKDYVNLQGKVVKVPEKPDQYTFTPPGDLTDGTVVPENIVTGFREAAHKAGMSNEQYQAALAYYANSQDRARKEAVKAEAAAITETTKALKSEFKDFDSKIVKARQLATKVGGEPFIGFLKKTKLGSHPDMIRFLFSVVDQVSEDVFITSKGKGSGGEMERTPGGTPLLNFPSLKKK